MKPEQLEFQKFIVQNVASDKILQADDLLDEAFTKQEKGTFNAEYLNSFIPRMMKLIKPESAAKVQEVLNNFKGL